MPRILLRLVAALAFAAPLPAQFGFLHSDPRIETLSLHDDGPAEMDERRILVLPFDVLQAGEPAPPAFAPHLSDALAAWLVAADVVVPRSHTIAGVDAARALGFDFLVRGRMELYYQGGASALRTRISAELVDLREEPTVILWQGRKTARWRRRLPPEECLLYLASDFVADWLREKH
ncbi:MAG: hypothetical protein GC160_04485 [Acidobacteria bacterium]|nr:hypothetical protein [Acidobacteriota bacterium]